MVKEIALIWMSAGNSYFDEETIGKLLRFADKKFQRVIMLSPDKPAEHTFRALGYPDNKARRKAKLNANLLMNRAKRELKKLKNHDKFSFVDWEDDIVDNSEYKKKYAEVDKLYKKNIEFRTDVRNITKEVIGDKFNEIKNMKNATDEAVLYLIEELSFVLASPFIYGAEGASYLYHQHWRIYENLIDGKYDGKRRETFSFILTGIK